ncbi:MAG TPA: nitroreductase family protein [Candidatus Latescibacteria bacterium]|nr:nitroreductase family protein [Candidatus Latescibacterota bacterium]HOS63131.1 nitroreductase family protein [Candidatus Latescibacterota bacterium]HPK75196.1 nitroreductase family protein [Candidatus Latescibacterota bacterium]
MDALTVIKTRRSVRAFADRQVPREVLEDIVDCGRLAATARNEQPWEFIVVTDPAMRAKIADLAEYGKFIAQASACIVVVCKDGRYFLEDGSAASQNILLGAWAHGVGSCWVAGDKKPYAVDVAKVLGVPDGYRVISLIALGYPQAPPSPKPKRALKEVLHWEKWI